MAKVIDNLEDDVARCKSGRGPQPYIRGRDDQWANQDDRHKAPADESADPTPKPVSQKRRDQGAAIRDEDRQEEPTHIFHRSRSHCPGGKKPSSASYVVTPFRSRSTTSR